MKNIIFDFDGPIFNGRNVAKETLQEIFQAYNIPLPNNLKELPLASPEIYVASALSNKDISVDVKTIIEEYHSKLVINEMYMGLRYDVIEGIKFLNQKNCQLFLLSDRSEMRLRRLLQWYGIIELFAEVIGRERFGKKPAVGSMLYLENNYNVEAETAWMVGDSDVDYEYAARVGCKYAYCAYSLEPCTINKADLMLENAEDIKRLL